MQNNELISKIITISSFSDEGSRVLIKDEAGKSFSFFKKTKDGDESVAWAGYREQRLEVGSRVGIKYQESHQTNQGGKSITYRNVRMFIPADDVAMRAEGKPVQEGKQVDWDEVSLGKCRYGFLIEAYRMGKALNAQIVKDANVWAKAAMVGEMPKIENNYSDIEPDGGYPEETI